MSVLRFCFCTHSNLTTACPALLCAVNTPEGDVSSLSQDQLMRWLKEMPRSSAQRLRAIMLP